MKSSNLLLSGLVFIFFFTLGCKDSPIDQSKKDFEKFNNYIRGYSQSPISRCNNIYVDLNFNLDNPNNQPFVLPHNLFEITPSVGGQPKLQRNGRRIQIEYANIKHNVQYTVKFNIGKLTTMPPGMESFSFPLEAERQSWDIVMEPPISKSMEFITYKGVVNFGVCETEFSKLEQSFTATQGTNPLQITWNHKAKENKSLFTIRNIERKDKGDIVDLNLSMNALNVNDEAKMKLAVPSKSDFSFHSFRVINNQHLQIIFSDPLKENQNLSGLIDVKGREIHQTKIKASVIDIFFKNENYGYFDLKVLPGIKNLAGFPFKDQYEKNIFFKPPLPQVNIAERGNILPPGNRWELPVSLISANGFRLRVLKVYDHNVARFYQENADPFSSQQGLENVGRIVLDTIYQFDKARPFIQSFHSLSLDRLVKKELGALYKIILTIPKEQSAFPCQEWKGRTNSDMVDNIDFDQPWVRIRRGYDEYYDDYDYYYYNNNLGNRNYREEYSNYHDDPCQLSHFDQIQDARLLMCTDIGLVVKSEPEKDNYFFYASNITEAAPLAYTKIRLYNIQGKKIAEGQSNSAGIANIKLKDKKPFLAQASYNGQHTYLPLQDAKALSLSTFQVEGKNWKGERKVYFYGDRDVWRPGDTIYMQSLVFSPEKRLPANLPVGIKLFDPNNRLMKEWTVSTNTDGIYNCQFDTDINDPTGYWRLEFRIGGKTHRKEIRIETIRPNRLKMNMAFANEEILRSTDSNKAPIDVKWMHGMEAKDLKTEVNMLQKSLSNPFGSNYENYLFNDINKRYDRELGQVLTKNTDSKGLIDFMIPVNQKSNYPSMMLFNFELRAFEKGGAFSSDMKAIKYSPYDHYVGLKFPGGNTSGHINVKDDEAIMVASINENGQEVKREVNVQLIKIDYKWWYQFGNRGDYAALSNYIGERVADYKITIPKEGGSISFKEYGRFLLKVTDIKSGHSVSRIIYSYSENWRDENEEVSQLEVLPLLIEKTSYKVGEIIEFELPAMSKGRYLISIENGGEIIHKEFRSTSKSPTQISINVTPDMAPTAYVHVHLIQAWNEHRNDRPLRLFGLKPIKVFDPTTILEPRILMADELKTDEKFSVSVKEANGTGMSYTLAIVDEGLLDITQFKTPDPWSTFFGKERLNVKTWDMYRDIFHRFLGEYTSLLAVGGDGSNAVKPASKARRFVPVVKFVGPFKLDPNETKKHEFEINNYVGSVRAMVIATNGKALGRYEKTVPVKKPLMLYSTLPRVIGPSEKMKVPVTVFSMEESIKEVTATIKVSDNIKVIGDKTKNIIFTKEGEKDIHFEIETEEAMGLAKVEVRVASGPHSFVETVNLDLRPSSPPISKTYNDLVEATSQKAISFSPIGMAGTQSGEVHLSKGLNFSFAPQVDWLSKYPHGCLEQTVSRIFPQIYLYQMNLLDDADKMKYRQQFAAAIQKLRYLQMPDGGFSYWPGGNKANSWGTTYAFQFLLEAKKYGYEVPQDMIDKCKKYQFKQAENSYLRSNNGTRNSSANYTIEQAYRLYTLAQAGKPSYAAMNRLRLVPDLANTARWLLAHSFIILNEKELADQIISSATEAVKDYRQMGGSFGSRIRDLALISRVLIDKGDRVKAKRLIDDMVNQFNGKELARLSTQDRAQSLITFAKFVNLDNVEDSIVYDLQLSAEESISDKVITEKPQTYSLGKEALQNGQVDVTNKGTAELYATVVVSGQPLRDDSEKEQQDLFMNIEYLNEEGRKLDPAAIKKGSDFIIQYTVSHDGQRGDYENLALSAIFPSGWEIINQRLNENSVFNNGDTADYQDIRDDRVYLYFDLNKNQKKVFRFKMNATYEGKYWAPPAYCEAMYDANVRSKSKGFWATIK